MDLNLPKAATAAVDEAAIKLDPLLAVALAGLKSVLADAFDGYVITISISKKEKPKDEPAHPAAGE